MSITRDWFPVSREEQLAMARNWGLILPGKETAWGIPAAIVTELSAFTAAADAALTAAKNEATRTAVATAQCREAFKNLEEKMRDIKRRFFFTPPLTEADLLSLGLKPHDPTKTPSGEPTAQVTAETYLVGRHELGVKVLYVTGSPGDPANKGFRIWYSVIAPGEAAPVDPEDLHKSFFTKRKKDVIPFDFGDSGKTAYLAIQIENEGKKGHWGPMVSAVIP
ncbi:MAG: hypothetical protein LBU25_06360 [Treponema sp.]|jgi:hypothetical protein|nr:hypothetical protein [Treponema sp.]